MDEQSVDELYDIFSLQSWDLPQIMESFSMLKRKLKVEKLHGLDLYKELKAGLGKVWKAKDLLSLLDKRANQKEYLGQVSTDFISLLWHPVCKYIDVQVSIISKDHIIMVLTIK